MEKKKNKFNFYLSTKGKDAIPTDKLYANLNEEILKNQLK